MTKFFASILFVFAVLFIPGVSADDRTGTNWNLIIETAMKTGSEGPARITSVGWSRTGKVAFIENLDPGESAPEMHLRLVVVDSVDDKTIFDKTILVDPDDPVASQPANVNALPDFVDFVTRLEAEGIQNAASAGVLGFPVTYHGETFNATVNEESDADGGYSVWVTSSSKGKKRITGGTRPPGKYYLLGYLQSPYEPRVLVLFEAVTRGFEGDSDRETLFSGCSLETRFGN